MKAIKISVIEFDYHPEVLRDFCRIISDTETIVNVYTTELIWRKVLTNNFVVPRNIVLNLKSKSVSVKKFINSNYDLLNSSDIILFDTLASNFRFFSKISFKPVIIVRIHNSNAYFNSLLKSYRPRFTPFFIWKDTSHFIRKEIGELDWHYRKKFLNNADYYAFPSQFIANYAIENYGINEKKTLTLPISFAPDSITTSQTTNVDSTNIVVIGRIDRRNRDYQVLITGFEKLLKQINKPIKLILLGASNSAYGKKVIKSFRALESDKFSLISYKNFVDQSAFSEHIKNASFIIIPVRINTRYTIYNEKYGYTKISGSINDLTKFQKYALIFSNYPVDDSLKPITESFSNDNELADKILDWSENKNFKQLDIESALRKYQLNSVRKLYLKTFNNILSTRK